MIVLDTDVLSLLFSNHVRVADALFVPDLPGCVAVAKTRRAVKRLIRDAIQLHIEDMRTRGYPIPKPTAASELVDLQSA